MGRASKAGQSTRSLPGGGENGFRAQLLPKGDIEETIHFRQPPRRSIVGGFGESESNPSYFYRLLNRGFLQNPY